MASTYLSRTVSSASNRKTWTWSAWVKRSSLSTGNQVLFQGIDSGFPEKIQFTGSDILEYDHDIAGTDYTVYTGDRRYRDTNAWYHIVVAKDTTQSTETDRIKIYVNGEQQSLTEYALGYPPQNYDGAINNTVVHNIGANNSSSSEVFDGYMSHVHFCDGSALAPTVFGSTDSTTGEWKINTSPSFTPGTNGFTILKDGNTITDQSANSNNFTLSSGTLTNTEDNPSNVFATFNVLNKVYMNSIANANTTIGAGNNGTDYSYIAATIGASSGKYYWEAKVTDLAEIDQVGVALASSNFSNAFSSGGLQATTFGGKSVQFSNGNKAGDGSQSAYMGGFSVNDIIMVALDLDNNKITFGRNGQWSDGSGYANQTYANSTAAFTNLTAGEVYIPAHAMRASGGNTGSTSYNFGNGYFGTTAVSSAGTNASGIGIFEYDVPTGYTALSTKGLNT